MKNNEALYLKILLVFVALFFGLRAAAKTTISGSAYLCAREIFMPRKSIEEQHPDNAQSVKTLQIGKEYAVEHEGENLIITRYVDGEGRVIAFDPTIARGIPGKANNATLLHPVENPILNSLLSRKEGLVIANSENIVAAWKTKAAHNPHPESKYAHKGVLEIMYSVDEKYIFSRSRNSFKFAEVGSNRVEEISLQSAPRGLEGFLSNPSRLVEADIVTVGTESYLLLIKQLEGEVILGTYNLNRNEFYEQNVNEVLSKEYNRHGTNEYLQLTPEVERINIAHLSKLFLLGQKSKRVEFKRPDFKDFYASQLSLGYAGAIKNFYKSFNPNRNVYKSKDGNVSVEVYKNTISFQSPTSQFINKINAEKADPDLFTFVNQHRSTINEVEIFSVNKNRFLLFVSETTKGKEIGVYNVDADAFTSKTLADILTYKRNQSPSAKTLHELDTAQRFNDTIIEQLIVGSGLNSVDLYIYVHGEKNNSYAFQTFYNLQAIHGTAGAIKHVYTNAKNTSVVPAHKFTQPTPSLVIESKKQNKKPTKARSQQKKKTPKKVGRNTNRARPQSASRGLNHSEISGADTKSLKRKSTIQ